MPIELNPTEQRVLGCLLEKAVLTPDQYPMTLNGLTNAANQKSSRDPVMALEQGQVLGTIRGLQDKRLVVTEENFKSQVEKYGQRFCNTPFSDYQFDAPAYAAVCVLLLRGPRTPGEIRANSGRLHTFSDNQEVQSTMSALMQIEGGPLVRQLARSPGRKDSEFIHLFQGVDALPVASVPPPNQAPASLQANETKQVSATDLDLADRVSKLELEVARLVTVLEQLQGTSE